PPHSHIDSPRNHSCGSSASGTAGAICMARTTTDCVATTASSHPPVIPPARLGLVSLTVNPANTAKVSSVQSTSVNSQRTVATPCEPQSTTNWPPRTPVAATTVKKPGPFTWSKRSLLSSAQYLASR